MRAYRLVTAVFVAMLVTSACTQTVWAQSRERAKLLRVSGLVKVKPAASPAWVKAELPGRASLAERDEVQTYQQARAVIGIDGGRVEMGPLTHVIIPGSKSAGAGRTASRLSLLTGKILIWLIGARPLEIGTAGAIACAKSTQFVVETDEAGHSTLTVIEGVVDFYNDLGRVVVAANEQSTASADSAPTRPARADKSSYIDFEASLDNLWLGYEKLVNPGQTRESLRQNAETAAQKATAAPGDAAAQEAVGDLLHDTGNLEAAGQAYAAARQLAPGSARLGLKQGYNLLQQGEAEAAGTLFAQLAAANPTSAAPLIGQAAALASSFDEAKLSAAQDVLGKALNLDGSNPEALLVAGVIAIRSGQTEAALTALGKAAAAPSPDYRALAYLSTVQLAQRQPQEALASARKAVALAPASALAHESLGTAAFFCGSTAEAAAETSLALELNPQSATAHLLASDLAVAQGDLDGGMAEAETAVELDPRLAPAHQAIGMIALAQNDLKRAEKAFGKALALQPKLVAARTGMGMTYSRQGKLTQALEQQQGAAALDSSSAAVQNNLGMIYLQTGRLEQAKAAFEATARLQPNWAIVQANLALAYLENNEYAPALAAAEKAVALGGDSARVRTTLARVYLRQGRTNAAWAQLRQALILDPNYALARMHLAEVYTALGRPEDATRERFVALSLQPAVMVDSREYARTEVEGAVGDRFSAAAKTMGRGDDGQSSYYVAAQHAQSDFDRPHTDAKDTTLVGIAGRQTAADQTAVIYVTGEAQRQDRPGQALAGGLPTDANYESKFQGAEAQVLTRQSAGPGGDLTLRFGYKRGQQRSTNPDSLLSDPKPFQRLEQTSSGPMAEMRLDKRLGQCDLLTLGAAWMARRNEISGLLGSGTPPVFAPFSNSDVRQIGAGYVEFQRLVNSRTQILLGGHVVAADETTPVIRPKASIRRQVSKAASVTLLTRPVLADEVSELSPVDPFALRSFMSSSDLARGGYSQSYELQYELAPPAGVMRVALFQRDLRNVLVDLEDPAWSLEAAPLVIGKATLRGAELECERQIGRDLTGGVWARYTDASNDDPGGADLPYQPTLAGQARLDYLDTVGWRIGADWSFVGKRYADVANTVRLGSYGLVNVNVARQLNLQTDVFVRVENALDRDYQYYRNYPGPGTQVVGGVRYRF